MAFTIRTREQLFAVAVGMARAQEDRGIHPAAAIRFGLISALLAMAGIPQPDWVSGFRTLTQQAALRTVVGFDGKFLKPAQRSWHTRGLAYDLRVASPSFNVFALLWTALGGRDGRDFLSPDPGHLDFPIKGLEPEAAF